MRNVVMHYHIFKNAGRTVDAVLARAFGLESLAWLDEAPSARAYPADALLARVRESASVRVVSSHQARLPVPDADDIAFHPLLFLRHPIDRVGSVYAFERRQRADAEGIGIPVAHREDFAGYVRWRLEEGNGSVIRNFQTVHVAGRAQDMRTAVATQADFETALQRLRDLPFFGLVERFDASIERMAAYLRPLGGEFDDASESKVEAVDASAGRATTLAQRLDDIETQLGPELHARLIENNRLDLALYAEAERLFDRAA